MSSTRPTKQLVLAAALALGTAFAVAQDAARAEPLQGGVQKTDLGFEPDHYGITVKPSSSSKFKAVIDNVRPGSVAFYGGLKNGDKIIKADASNKDKVIITFDRGGTTYGVTLKGSRKPLDLAPPAVQANLHPALNLTPEQKEKLIAAHDIVVLLDQTQSMATPDCPGGVSRWEWCRRQTLDFMHDMQRSLRDITVVTFNTSFHEFEHADASQIAQIYSSYHPTGGTDMATPLAAIFNDYFHKKAMNKNMKPLLVAVVSDGMPNMPGGPPQAKKAVEDAIIEAAKHILQGDELTVTFLQIGNDFEGGDFLSMLDEGLPGKFDVVDTKTFAQLQQIGLKDALVDALTERQLHASAGAPLKDEIKDLTKRSRQLHDQLKQAQ